MSEKTLDAVLWNLIVSGLKNCIKDHGPIEKGSNIGSAAKRIIKNILESEEFRANCPEDLYNKMIVDTLEIHYHQIISAKDRRISRLTQKLGEELPNKVVIKEEGTKIIELNNKNQSLQKRIKQLEAAKGYISVDELVKLLKENDFSAVEEKGIVNVVTEEVDRLCGYMICLLKTKSFIGAVNFDVSGQKYEIRHGSSTFRKIEEKLKKSVITDEDRTMALANKLWELAGKPEGQAEVHWRQAEWLLYRI